MTGAVVTMTIRRSFQGWRLHYDSYPNVISPWLSLKASLPPRPGAVDGRIEPDRGQLGVGVSGRCAHLPFAGRDGMRQWRSHNSYPSSTAQLSRAFSTTETFCCHEGFAQKFVGDYGDNLSQPFPAETEVGR